MPRETFYSRQGVSRVCKGGLNGEAVPRHLWWSWRCLRHAHHAEAWAVAATAVIAITAICHQCEHAVAPLPQLMVQGGDHLVQGGCSRPSAPTWRKRLSSHAARKGFRAVFDKAIPGRLCADALPHRNPLGQATARPSARALAHRVRHIAGELLGLRARAGGPHTQHHGAA